MCRRGDVSIDGTSENVRKDYCMGEVSSSRVVSVFTDTECRWKLYPRELTINLNLWCSIKSYDLVTHFFLVMCYFDVRSDRIWRVEEKGRFARVEQRSRRTVTE